MDPSVVDDIMASFHLVGQTHEVIQNTKCSSPPPLDQSYYLVPKPNTEASEIDRLKNLCDSKSNELVRLKALNDTTFRNIKKAMEKLSPDTIHLFPQRLKSRFIELQEENAYLKKKLKLMKRNETQ